MSEFNQVGPDDEVQWQRDRLPSLLGLTGKHAVGIRGLLDDRMVRGSR